MNTPSPSIFTPLQISIAQNEKPELGYTNVSLAFSFILIDALTSFIFGLGIGTSLIVSSIRCVVQLSLVAMVLGKVFESNSPWVVAFFVVLLNVIGTLEIVVNKANRRHKHMFIFTLMGMLLSSIPISIVGARFAMSKERFWEPSQFIPIVGMLCGNTISGIVVSVNYLLKELEENRDRVEMYLAFGASRMEACKPMAVEALRLALTPIVNKMSVLGIISIPGMMTGAILGGSSVQNAARLQVIIIFMISASTSLAAIMATLGVLGVVVDGEGRIREDRIDGGGHLIWKVVENVWEWLDASWGRFQGVILRRKTEGNGGEEEQEREEGNGEDERERLLI